MDWKGILDELDYIYYKYGKALIGLIVVVLVAGVGIFTIQQKESEGIPKGPEEVIRYLIDESAKVREVFSKLGQTTTSADKKYPVYEIDLYLKKPFIEEGDLEQALRDYTELIKLVDKQEGKYPRAIRYRIYDRKILYDQNLLPKGTYEYRYTMDQIKEDDLKKNSVTGEPYESYTEGAWRITTEKKGKPKYDKYGIQGNYQTLKVTYGSEPLTDQEFEWYLKINRYNLIGNQGIELYAMWDLGVKEDNTSIIRDQYLNLKARLNAIGDSGEFYDLADEEVQKLAITNPQLVVFGKYHQVVKDDIEARSLLVQRDPELFAEVIDKWLEEQAKEQVNNLTNNNGAAPQAEELMETTTLTPTESSDPNNQYEYNPVTESQESTVDYTQPDPRYQEAEQVQQPSPGLPQTEGDGLVAPSNQEQPSNPFLSNGG